MNWRERRTIVGGECDGRRSVKRRKVGDGDGLEKREQEGSCALEGKEEWVIEGGR